MLRQLETCCFVLAIVLVVAIEVSCVYAIWFHPSLHRLPTVSVPIYGYWMRPTLPQCWLIGGLLILIYRLTEAALPLRTRDSSGSRVNGNSLLRQWTWLIALAVMHGCALYLDYSVMVSR
jgi:hypothetical protein